ncbi:hypothetical protein PENTCL1PPCAC_2718, partial [Pristionchus entomophagus]
FQMASSAFFAFILVPLILVAIALYAYRRLQRQKLGRESCAPCNGNANVMGAPLPIPSLHSAPLPVLEPSALPYSPQSVFALTTLTFPSPSSPPPYPDSVLLPSPPVTPAVPIPDVPLPPYSDRMVSVDLRDDPPPAYEDIAEKIEKNKK